MTASPGSAVEADGLEKRFELAVALRGFSLRVEPGELFGLVGPDGAGKTTFFRVLTGLLRPDAGSARVLGHDAVTGTAAIRRRIGYMPALASVYPDLSVDENLRFFASVFGTDPDEGRDMVAPVYEQLEPFADRRAEDLSGGMRQKLALSCALIHRPDLLLLDEPTTGVDAVSRRELWDLLGRLAGEGLTAIVSTPYMDEATRCDRVALVQDGRVLRIDAPGAIGDDYGRPLVAVRGPDRYRLLGELRRHPHAASVHPFGAELHFTDDRADAEPAEIADGLLAWLRRRGSDVDAVSPIDPGIEDVFMALMEGPVREPSHAGDDARAT